MRPAIWTRLDGTLRSTTSVYASCVLSLALGLGFIFVWSPLPWGWEGIDLYYDMGRALARGEPFSTIHVTWGYPYFLSFFYRLFGDRPWVPLCAQAALNATIPLMLYRLGRLEIGPRVGVMSAIVAGLCSFNTVYTSTQSTDSVCTVLFVAAVLAFAMGRARGSLGLFALSGLLVSLAFQFRPNFVLFPAYAAALYLVVRPRGGLAKFRQTGVFLVAFALGAAPWVIRNYRWTGVLVPASTHGGVQLWFGSLQSGPYLDNWLYNPRAAFEHPPVDYSSIDELPVVISGSVACGLPGQRRVDLVYWTNRDLRPQRLPVVTGTDDTFAVALPWLPTSTAVSYYFESWVGRDGLVAHATTPPAGVDDPLLFTLSRDHLGDLDLGGQSLDVFDLARIARQLAWGDGQGAGALNLDGDGAITQRDLRLGAAWLAGDSRSAGADTAEAVARVILDEETVSMVFADGSALAVPRRWDGRITSLVVRGKTAESLVSRSRSLASLRLARAPALSTGSSASRPCVMNIGANRVPYRRLPHEMRRFTALAVDNILREPWAYAVASAYRALRLFVVEGSDDKRTAVQFAGSSVGYRVSRAAGVVLFGLFAAGLIVALVRRERTFMLLMPIVHVPATIAFMLINARYSVSIQPFTFVFIAILLVALLDRASGRSDTDTPCIPRASARDATTRG